MNLRSFDLILRAFVSDFDSDLKRFCLYQMSYNKHPQWRELTYFKKGI